MLDGRRTYLHAIIDNFLRRILAWKVAERFHPAVTAELFLRASKRVTHGTPVIVVLTQTAVYDKTMSAVQEVKARGATVLAVAYEDEDYAYSWQE